MGFHQSDISQSKRHRGYMYQMTLVYALNVRISGEMDRQQYVVKVQGPLLQ